MPSSTSTGVPEKSTSRFPSWATAFGPQIVAGLVLGVIIGLVARAMPDAADGNVNWLVGTVQTIGSSYVKLLTVAVIPLVFTAIVSSIANLRQVANAARLAVQTLLWFAITAFIAVIIGIIVGLITDPGSRTDVAAEAAKEPKSSGSWWAFITGLVPNNFLGLGAKTSVAEGVATTSLSFNVLQLLVIAGAIGIAALKIGPKAAPFLEFNASAARDRPEGPVVDHSPRPNRYGRTDRQRCRHLRLGCNRLARRIHRSHLHRSGHRLLRGLPHPDCRTRSLGSKLLLRCLARNSARIRLALVDRAPCR